jgi:YbbR domain-containing protein
LRSFIQKYVLNELKLKILALALAILLWFSMTYLGESKMTYSVPISYENLGRSLSVRNADKSDVTILLNGPLYDLKNLKPKDIKVSVDLGRIREGRQFISIKKGDVVVPNRLKIDSINPDYVVLEIERIMEKDLRTIVKLDQKWESIYRIVSWSPRNVAVEGPESVLAGKKSVDTIPVDGDLRQQQEILDVPLNIKSLAARKVQPETVRVVLKRIAK